MLVSVKFILVATNSQVSEQFGAQAGKQVGEQAKSSMSDHPFAQHQCNDATLILTEVTLNCPTRLGLT